MPTQNKPVTLRLGHSPDPDDAFMWYPLTVDRGNGPILTSQRFTFEAVADDIESLNARATTGELEITAISIANYPSVADRYALTACGSSMGDGYGPKVVARGAHDLAWLTAPGRRIAIPGWRTSAYLATAMMLNGAQVEYVPVGFDKIMERVSAGDFDAGVVIHEGQLTFESHGLNLIVDLGAWWKEQTGLPLPLGGNAVRRDLDDLYGPGTLGEVSALLEASVSYSLAHREESLDYALQFGRGLERDLADRFVAMYVNKLTLDFGPTGRAAVERFLGEAATAGLVPNLPDLDFVGQSV